MLFHAGPAESTKSNLLKAVIAGALIWVAIDLIARAYQPARAGSFVANVEIVLSVMVAIVACLLLRWP